MIGTVIGSFLNVLVFRTHGNESLLGRSHCMTCEQPIKFYDLIPVLSFFLLRRRCRHCRAPISWQYPLIEFTTGLLFMLIYLRYDEGIFVPAVADSTMLWLYFWRDVLFALLLVIVFVYDLRYTMILDRFTLPAMIVALILNFWLGVPATSLLLGGFLLAFFFAAQFLISEGRWVGGGDIRMGALMGFMLGFQNSLVALFIAYMLGAAVGLLLVLSDKATPKSQIPFGTFLAIATFIALTIGDQIVTWYLSLLA